MADARIDADPVEYGLHRWLHDRPCARLCSMGLRYGATHSLADKQTFQPPRGAAMMKQDSFDLLRQAFHKSDAALLYSRVYLLISGSREVQ